MQRHTVVFLVFDGIKALDVAGAAEVFAEANRHGADYRIRYCSPSGSPVSTSIGADMGVDCAAESIHSLHTVIVCGGDSLPGRPLEPVVVDAARLLLGRAERVVSICTGAFILAEAGALDGRRATTHWQHVTLLSRGYPKVKVQPDAIFTHDEKVYTSAGVTAGIDLALALIEDDHGADTARAVARGLVVYVRRAGSQSQFSAPLANAISHHSRVQRVIDSIHAAPADPFPIRDLAETAGISERHLTRLFRQETGLTPAKYIEGMRLDLAKAHLDSGATVTSAAAEGGFGSEETMRRAFAARLGVSPSEYRQRFLTSAPHR